MPTFNVRIDRDNTAKFRAALPKAVKMALEEIGDAIVENVKDRVPIDTGALRDSYIADVDERAQVVNVGSPLEYSSYVELGTGPNYEKPPDWVVNNEKRGHHDTDPWWYLDDDGEWKQGWFVRSQPHLRPAFLENVEEYKRIFKDELEHA